MPTSNLALWPSILHLVWEVKPARVLDVGPGWGKAAGLLREYVDPAVTVDAVEAWPGYVTDRLRAAYDDVLVADALTLSDEVLGRYDLVLMVEVIEHMEKGAALALLSRVRCPVVVCTPAEFFSNGPDLPPTEDHVSLWSVSDFGDRVEADRSEMGAVLVRLSGSARAGENVERGLTKSLR